MLTTVVLVKPRQAEFPLSIGECGLGLEGMNVNYCGVSKIETSITPPFSISVSVGFAAFKYYHFTFFRVCRFQILPGIILLSSGAINSVRAHHAIVAGTKKEALYGLAVTTLFVVIFTCFTGF